MKQKLAIGLLLAGLLGAADQPGKDIRFAAGHQVFPHIAIGGVWSSEITFVNIEGGPAVFPLRFFRPDGTPWPVSVPGAGTSAEWTITVPPGGMFTFALASPGPTVQTGWAIIVQPTGATIGGHIIFQDRTPGRPLFEAVVPLSLYWENLFYMPFDNTNGNTTCIALVNSGPSDTFSSVEFFDPAGGLIYRGSGPMPLLRGSQVSGCLPNDLPATAGRRGVMRVTGSAPRLSALGFRFNPGGAFTTLFPMSR